MIQDEDELLTPPELTVNLGPTIVFVDDLDWRNSITGITYYFVVFSENIAHSVNAPVYNISPGEILVPYPDPWVEVDVDLDDLPEGWDSQGFQIEFFVVNATGYEDAITMESLVRPD